jgi:16S rRNA (adenine1518-N6/adenine1519-N6)-dimethyltransferase
MTTLRRMAAQFDIHPRKRLGQCFLEDMNIVRRITDLAEPAADQTIVEIGAGLGFLTEALAQRAGRVIALEVDPRLVTLLRERFRGNSRVEVLETDVLKYDFSSALPQGRVNVVGNLPYHISTPILFRLLAFRRSITSMILMFQKELADRITASPGSKDYGIPSVLVAAYARAVCEMTVAPTCFYPVPDVVSSVLRFTMQPGRVSSNEACFEALVHAAFARRRKTLWNNLRCLAPAEGEADLAFVRSGIDRNRRAETLSVEEFSRLAACWTDDAPTA